MPRPAGRRMQVPTKRVVLDLLVATEVALSSIMRRWQDDGLSAEIRAEIMVDIYEPVLQMLIRSKRIDPNRRGASLPLPPAWR